MRLFHMVPSEQAKLASGLEAVLPYLRRILILSKWETGTAHVR